MKKFVYALAAIVSSICSSSCVVEFYPALYYPTYSPEISSRVHYFPNTTRYKHYSSSNYYNYYKCDRRLPIRSRQNDIFIFEY